MEKSTVVVTSEKYVSRSEENITHEYTNDNPFATPQDQRSIYSSAHPSYSIFTGMYLCIPYILFSLTRHQHVEGPLRTHIISHRIKTSPTAEIQIRTSYRRL